jgi:hypothetical protein
MKLSLATIIITALVKSGSASFSYVGKGTCVDSDGQAYDLVRSNLSPLNVVNATSAAIAWCKETAGAYASKLVGVEVRVDTYEFYQWICDYEDGTIDDMQVVDGQEKLTEFIGTGVVDGANAGWIEYTCYKNNVRPNDSNCMISFIIFSHAASPNSLILYQDYVPPTPPSSSPSKTPSMTPTSSPSKGLFQSLKISKHDTNLLSVQRPLLQSVKKNLKESILFANGIPFIVAVQNFH